MIIYSVLSLSNKETKRLKWWALLGDLSSIVHLLSTYKLNSTILHSIQLLTVFCKVETHWPAWSGRLYPVCASWIQIEIEIEFVHTAVFLFCLLAILPFLMSLLPVDTSMSSYNRVSKSPCLRRSEVRQYLMRFDCIDTTRTRHLYVGDNTYIRSTLIKRVPRIAVKWLRLKSTCIWKTRQGCLDCNRPCWQVQLTLRSKSRVGGTSGIPGSARNYSVDPCTVLLVGDVFFCCFFCFRDLV